MSEMNEHILGHLNGDEIRYHSLGEGTGSMSVTYFERSFELLAATEQPNLGQFSYYYQSRENPDLVMHFTVCSTGLTATLIRYGEAQQ